MNIDRGKSKFILKFIVVVWILIFWGIVSYFIWKPLIIPFLILFSGYGSKYLRNNLIYGSYLKSIISGAIWGFFLAFSLYYLANLTHSLSWWRLTNYFFGFLAAGYIGYRSIVEAKMLDGSKLESYYIIVQFTSIILYIIFLLSLHFII